MDGQVGFVFGTGRCEMYINFVHKCCEKNRNFIYVFVYGKIILLRILGNSLKEGGFDLDAS